MLYLVDASVYVFRAYYSIPDRMTDADGNPTNAVYGFARFLGDLIEEAEPALMAVAFDESLTSSFRNDIYPEYKANREPAPADLERQFELCRAVTRALGVADFASETHEADDIIGTIAAKMRRSGDQVVIVSRDKDLAQLLKPGDVYWDYAAGKRLQYDDIEDAFGVVPERIADFLALTGDAVDNIPGVPGVGKKTAAALFATYESLEALYDNLDAVPGLPIRGAKTLPAKLDEHRDTAFFARRLTRIDSNMQLTCQPRTLTPRGPDMDELVRLYDDLGFGPMIRRQAERLAGLALA